MYRSVNENDLLGVVLPDLQYSEWYRWIQKEEWVQITYPETDGTVAIYIEGLEYIVSV